MIKTDITKKVAQQLEMKDREALGVVDGILDSLKEVICEYQRLEIRDFGVFQVKTRKRRVGRNPRNKTEYPIPARRVVTFKIGKEMKARALTSAGAAALQKAEPASRSADA